MRLSSVSEPRLAGENKWDMEAAIKNRVGDTAIQQFGSVLSIVDFDHTDSLEYNGQAAMLRRVEQMSSTTS